MTSSNLEALRLPEDRVQVLRIAFAKMVKKGAVSLAELKRQVADGRTG